EVADERRGDDERDFAGAAAEATHDDRHEGDEHRDVEARADRAEEVDAKIPPDARGRPVRVHEKTNGNALGPSPGRRTYGLGPLWSRPVTPWPRSEATTGPIAAGPRPPGRGTARAAAIWRAGPEYRGPARARRRRADDDAAIRVHAHRLRPHPGAVLNRQVHDPPLVGEHRLERHGLPHRPHPHGDAARDLAQLLLATTPVALDVERDVNGA